MNDFKEVYDKIYPELKVIYDNEIQVLNKKLSIKKNKFLKKIIIIDSIIILILGVIFKETILYYLLGIIVWMIIISGIVCKFKFFKDYKKITKHFKHIIIKKIIDNVYQEECVINVDKGITEKEYNPNIYGDMYNRFYSNDLVYLKENRLFFSELLVQYYSSSGKNSSTTTIFKGIAGQKILSKNINCKFSILSNRLFMDNRVKLDSSEFEKYFDIKSEDKILAMRFLTSDIMGMMVTLREKYDCKFELGIIDEILYFRILTCKNFFELPNLKKGLDIEYLKNNTDILFQIKKLTVLIDDIVKEI